MASSVTNLRPGTRADGASCADIYAAYVTGTSISFEVEPPTAEQFAQRIAEAQEAHAWLVAERGGVVIGYAYAHRFAERQAYGWSCETSIYLAQTVRREGVGRALYGKLLAILAARGYRRAFAGITLPNEASVGLHRAFGFQDAGCYRRVGWKHGAWHDVLWMQRDLQSTEVDPPSEVSPRHWATTSAAGVAATTPCVRLGAELLQRIEAIAGRPGKRSERAQGVADLIRDATDHRWVGIYTVTGTCVVNEAWSGPGPPAFPTFSRERGLTAHALRARAPALSNDVAEDPRYLPNQDDSGSELILPVIIDRQAVGTLDLESDEVGAFDGTSIARLESLAQALAALWHEPSA